MNPIIERIKKLQNLAESAKKIGSLQEAEAAASKAAQLIREYNLSQSDLENEVPIYVERRIPIAHYAKFHWELHFIAYMISLIAEQSFCIAQLASYRPRESDSPPELSLYDVIFITGKEENIEAAIYIFETLVEQLRVLASQAWDNYNKEFDEPKPELPISNMGFARSTGKIWDGVRGMRIEELGGPTLDSWTRQILGMDLRKTEEEFFKSYFAGSVMAMVEKYKKELNLMEAESKALVDRQMEKVREYVDKTHKSTTSQAMHQSDIDQSIAVKGYEESKRLNEDKRSLGPGT